MIQRLVTLSEELIATVSTGFKRFLFYRLDLKAGVTGIVGPRGTGKSTLLLQLAREKLRDHKGLLYLSMDDPVFSSLSLVELAREFCRRGGSILLLDELHRYPDALADLSSIRAWAPELRILFACSSAGNEEGMIYELSRFADLHYLPALSFREYLQFMHGFSFPVIGFEELLDYNLMPGAEVYHRIRPLQYFDEYLHQGFYPFKKAGLSLFERELTGQLLRSVAEDIMAVWHMDYDSLAKVNRIMGFIADMGPVRPNIESLAKYSGTSRDSLLKFLKYLHKAGLIGWMTSGREDINYANKPDRLYLNNPNLCVALAREAPARSALLETLVQHHLKLFHQVNLENPGELLVDLEYRFELSWMSRSAGSRSSNAFRLVDGLERKSGGHIPLWMLGFFY